MKKEKLINLFAEVLWKHRKYNRASMPPWEYVSVLDVNQQSKNTFLVLVRRKLQDLHREADYETFEYIEIYQFIQKKDSITYKLLHRSLFLHVYTYDGFPGLFNTRRYEKKELFYDPDKKLNKIISDMKFLSESEKEVVLKAEIENFRDFHYRYRCR